MASTKLDAVKFMKGLNDPESPYYVPKQEHEMRPFKGLKDGIKIYKGLILPMVSRNVEIVKSMDVKPDDTFVVSFPKSGKITYKK